MYTYQSNISDVQDITDQHRAVVPDVLPTKKNKASDVLTIFSDRCTVKFCQRDGLVDTLKGRWCNVCRSVMQTTIYMD